MKKIVKNFNIFLPISIIIAALLLLVIGWKYGRFFETLNGVLIAGTLFWLWKYTKATEDMKRQMVLQNDYLQRPVVNLYYRYAPVKPQHPLQPKEGCFALRNVSGVTAYNITIENIVIDNFTYKFFIDEQNNILEKDKDEKKLTILCETSNCMRMNDEVSFQRHFALQSLKADEVEDAKNRFTSFIIRYQSLSGKKYYSVFKYYAKHPLTDEVIIEFIASAEGDTTFEKAKEFCRKSPKQESVYKRELLLKKEG